MGSLAPDSMVKRIYWCMCSLDPGQTEPSDSEKTSQPAATSGVSREQLIVFLADTLRGTAEERAPLILTMSHNAAGVPKEVTCEQVVEVSTERNETGDNIWIHMVYFLIFFIFPQFLQDLISAVVQIMTCRGRLQGWHPDKMGETSLGIKLLAEQMCSELKPSGKLLI